MGELTPEEKRRIYEEEKERIKAQEKIKKKTKPTTWGCLILIIFFAIVVFNVLKTPKETKVDSSKLPLVTKEEKVKVPTPRTPERKKVELKASVIFTGTQFVITNKNNFNWTNARLEVNRGYYYETQIIRPNVKYTVGAMQFTKRDGTRFNPFSMKPKEIFIACDTPKGRAYYTGGW